MSPGCWTTREFLASGNINQRELSISNPRPATPSCLQAPVLNASCQTTSKTGTQTHPSTDRLPKVVLSSQTSQNTPPETALPIRGTISSSTHQNTGTSPSHQEAYTSHWTNLTHQGQTQPRGTMTLQPVEKRPQTQQVRQHEKTEKYVAVEGAR